MAIIIWDQVGDRIYETGLDRGVLYLSDGSAVPWNGLVSVVERNDKETSPIYFDGMKISDVVTLGGFSGSIKAITYPDEFAFIDGLGQATPGLLFGDQPPQVFGLSYRTKVGNDVDGTEAGYKIHVLYNVTAVANDKTYSTMSADPNLVDFEWDITAVPEEIIGFRPTAHIIIDSQTLSEELLITFEEMLYGSESSNPALIPISDLITYINYEYKFKIIDNGNGTWTAITPDPELMEFSEVDEGLFTLYDTEATYLTDDLYQISNSYISEE